MPIHSSRYLTQGQYFLFICMACGASCYLAKLTISPAYFIVGVSALSLIIWRLAKGFAFSLDVFVAIVLFCYVIFSQFSYFNGAVLNLLLALLCYIVIRAYRKSISVNNAASILSIGAWFALIILAIDSIYRIAHPTAPSDLAEIAIEDSNSTFYLYKFGSLMFADSNTTALVALCFLCGLYKAKAENIKINNYLIVGLVIVILSTLSRAAWISTAVLLVQRKIKIGLKSFVLISFLVSLFLYFFLASKDGSLFSKIYIFGVVFEYFSRKANFVQSMFGIGLDQSKEVFGISTHIILLTYLVEMGFFGLFGLIIWMWTACRTSKNMSLILLPISLVGMSYFLYAGAPFFTIPFALATLIHSSKEGDCNNQNI